MNEDKNDAAHDVDAWIAEDKRTPCKKSAAQAEYWRVMVAAQAELDRVTSAAWAEYDRARAAASAELNSKRTT